MLLNMLNDLAGSHEGVGRKKFALLGRCCGFCDFAVSFLVPPDGPKNGPVKCFFFFFYQAVCGHKNVRRSHFGSVFQVEVFCRSTKF